MSGYGKHKYRARANFAHAMAEIVRNSHVRLITIADFDYALSSTIKVKGLDAAVEENIADAVRYLAEGRQIGTAVTNRMVVARVNEQYLADMNPATWEVPIPTDDAALAYTPGYGIASANAGIYIVKSINFPMTEEGRRLARANHFVTEMVEEGMRLAQQRTHDLLMAEGVYTAKQLAKIEKEALDRLTAA